MVLSGIYQVKNLVNGKVYIGSAVNLDKREWEHFNYPPKSSPILQKSMLKHGKENFEFSCIQYCDREVLYPNEQWWLDHTLCYERDKGYNISKIAGEGVHGGTKESAKKMMITKRLKGLNKETYPLLSTSKLGIKNPMFGKTGINNGVTKEVHCYNMEGEYLKSFIGIKEASKQLKIGVIKMKRKSSYNYRFSLIKYDYLPKLVNEVFSKIRYKNTITGEIIDFPTLISASRYLNIKQSAILHRLNKKESRKILNMEFNYI